MEIKTFTATKTINGKDREVVLCELNELDYSSAPDDGRLALVIKDVTPDEAFSLLGAIADKFIIVNNAAAQAAAAGVAKADIRGELAAAKAAEEGEPKKKGKGKKKSSATTTKGGSSSSETKSSEKAEEEKPKPKAKKETKAKNGTAKKSTKTKAKKTAVKDDKKIEVVDKTEDVDDDGFPTEEEPEEPGAPAVEAADAGEIPEEVKTQTTARGLLTMLHEDFESGDELIAHCVSIQAHVPLLARMGDGCAKRIGKALEILKLYPEDNA